MGAFYCAVCKKTSFAGKGHIYEKSHQAKLKVLLVKFLDKVKEARRTIKSPQVEQFDGAEHDKNFWCYCCGLEVRKHVSNGNVTVLYGGLLEHMATLEHKKNTNKFWWDNKADPKLKDKFLITPEETERFKAEVAKALDTFEVREDALIKQQADLIRAQEQRRLEVLQSVLEPEEEPGSPEQGQRESEGVGGARALAPEKESEPAWTQPLEQSYWPDPGINLTFIGYQDSSSCGNIHTGAVPPWLQDDPLEGCSTQEIGPSYQEFLKQKEQEKLRKLPPNRVGANFDHSSKTDANWLPSFGRVWNSGRRWQSRRQFREEEKEGDTRGQKRKRHARGKLGLKLQWQDLE